MKAGLEQLIGKTIASVVVDQNHGRVFLAFTDHTHFEFYSGAVGINWARGVDPGGTDKVLESLRNEPDDAVAVLR